MEQKLGSATSLNKKFKMSEKHEFFFFPLTIICRTLESQQSRLLCIDANVKNRGCNTVVCKALSGDVFWSQMEKARYRKTLLFDSRSLSAFLESEDTVNSFQLLFILAYPMPGKSKNLSITP